MNDGPPEAPVGLGHGSGTWRVTAPELGAMRRRVREAAREAGLDTDDTDRFIVAVNEVVINALQHGGGVADVAVRQDGGVLVTVVDSGRGPVPEGPFRLPPPEQEHGRGLWLVHRLCDDVTIDNGPGGTEVRLRARRPS